VSEKRRYIVVILVGRVHVEYCD